MAQIDSEEFSTSSHPASSRLQAWETPLTCFFLALVVWIARFLHFQQFGLYEDDYYRVGVALGMTRSQVLSRIQEFFLFPGQGRPLHDSPIFFFAYLGEQLGDLSTVYLIGYGIVAANALLFYLLLKRVYQQQPFALLGGLSFALYPADTTQIYLTHTLGVQPSITFLLIALHCYLARPTRPFSYLFALGSLLCYETLFTVFVTAPLLKQKWDATLKRELIRHILLVGTLFTGVVIVRLAIGTSPNSRGLLSLLLLVGNPIAGPFVAIATYPYRAIETLFKLKGELLILLPPCFLALGWIFWQLKPSRNFPASPAGTQRWFKRLKLPQSLQNYGTPALTGIVMMVFAYPLTLSAPAILISGRGTRVHTAAVLGASLLCASILASLLSAAKARRQRQFAVRGLAAFFSLAIGFGLVVQQDYTTSWAYQRAFWTDVARLVPDVEEGTVIAVEPTGLRDTRQWIFFQEPAGVRDTRQIQVNGWSMPFILEQLYQFPPAWKTPPRVYRAHPNWEEKVLASGQELKLDNAVQALKWLYKSGPKVESSNLIVLSTQDGKLTRRTEPLEVEGTVYPLKEEGTSQPNAFAKGHLYQYLIRKDSEKPLDYLLVP